MLCELDKTIKSRSDSYAFPGVSYARDLQAQGACALRFFIQKSSKNPQLFDYGIQLLCILLLWYDQKPIPP